MTDPTPPTWHGEPWTRLTGARSYRWWHWVRLHKTHTVRGLTNPPYAWECKTCNVVVGHY